MSQNASQELTSSHPKDEKCEPKELTTNLWLNPDRH